MTNLRRPGDLLRDDFDLEARVATLERILVANRIIVGSISGAGAIVAGRGFSVAKTGTGLYTITFDVAMLSRPAVTLTPQDTATSAASHASLTNGTPPTTAGFHVVTANAGATTTIDVAFDFVAVST